MQLEQQFKNHLQTGGERVTTTRLGIFRILLRHAPISMAKLRLLAAADGIDPVTVYRTVALFQRLGLAREVGLGRNRLLELTDDFGGHHHHFWCSHCGRVTDFDNPALEHAIQSASQELGLAVHSHQLEITGLCADCRQA